MGHLLQIQNQQPIRIHYRQNQILVAMTQYLKLSAW